MLWWLVLWLHTPNSKYHRCTCKRTENAPYCDGSHRKPEVLQLYTKQLLQANSEFQDELTCLKQQNKRMKLACIGLGVLAAAVSSGLFLSVCMEWMCCNTVCFLSMHSVLMTIEENYSRPSYHSQSDYCSLTRCAFLLCPTACRQRKAVTALEFRLASHSLGPFEALFGFIPINHYKVSKFLLCVEA